VRPMTRARLSYEVFMARLSLSNSIIYQGVAVAGYPRVAGVHVAIQPVKGWTISANRVLQFGGGGRPQSLNSLFRAFFNPYKYDNTNPGAGSGADTEFGNEQVSFTSELTVPGRMPASVYAEYAAEDTFHTEPYRYGNGALSFGIFLPKLRPNLQVRYEFSNWEDVWYVHHLYLDGLTNYGHVLGNWAADWRAKGDAAGGQSHMLQVNWRRDNEGVVMLRYRRAQNASYTGQGYKLAHMLSASISGPWRQFEIGGSVDAGRDMYGKIFGRVAATVTITGDAHNTVPRYYAQDGGAAPASGVVVERFVEAGVISGSLRYEQDLGSLPTRNTSGSGAHVGIGVRRSTSKHSDFGARLELDGVGSHSMLSVRALDYRYRFNSKLAATAFFGFSRYDARTPAHGYYLGGGAQWRNILPGWDLNADVHYFDRIVRKKITPGEVTIDWPNEYWTMTSGALYLSRRF
jgi:Capsule assembly protein Wzi